nr:MAG TPA: hypothetical protein [Caudoviricetes sp.]DAK96806.1 MAG TPA: hypothetical protein [Caudoviricetes sp.]DAR43571.1 MAG TPA: hypothetical protein [Caudoviricetes sp.]
MKTSSFTSCTFIVSISNYYKIVTVDSNNKLVGSSRKNINISFIINIF